MFFYTKEKYMPKDDARWMVLKDEKEKIITILCPYKQIPNSFSVAIKNNKGFLVAEQFYKCREIFHEDFPYTKI